MADKLIQLYVLLVAIVCVVSLAYVYISPPASMQFDRDGVAHFTPDVMHPETGESIRMGDLIRHFRGD